MEFAHSTGVAATGTAAAGHKSAPAATFAAADVTCPRCREAVRRTEQTEWLTFYGCPACGWRFAKSRPKGSY